MASEIRQKRVVELLFEELSVMISTELADPQISLVEVLEVRISKDLRNAKVFVHHQDEAVSSRDLLRALQRATPYMRGQLAVRCGLRMVPDLFFSYDDSPAKAARVDEILQQLSAERNADEESPSVA